MTYVNWKAEAKLTRITIEEAEEKVEYLKKFGNKARSKTKRADWRDHNTWTLMKDGYWNSLCTKENGKFYRYTWNEADNEKNSKDYKPRGAAAAHLINSKFQERTGLTLRGAFGYVEQDSWIRKCVPRPFYYKNKLYMNRVISEVSHADFSSNYPSNICGKLPDIRTAVEFVGEVEPTADYPFAFYNNGHCAEYDRFDTRKYADFGELTEILTVKNELPVYVGKIKKTILCKASEYELTEEYNHFYDLKQQCTKDSPDYNNAKLVLNASIGMFHAAEDSNRTSYRLHHLAAVCLGRANQLMLDTIAKIGPKNILQIVVDGIFYKDKDQIQLTEEKKLGKLVLEVHKADFKMIGINQLLMIKDGKVVKKSAAGFNNFAVEKTTRFEDMKEWGRI